MSPALVIGIAGTAFGKDDSAACASPGFRVIWNESVVCRYYWHSAGSLSWPFRMLKYKYTFQIKYTDAILSNSTPELLWFEITKMLIAVLKHKFIMLFKKIIFGTLSFPIVLWLRLGLLVLGFGGLG